jgi:hypothetical protein
MSCGQWHSMPSLYWYWIGVLWPLIIKWYVPIPFPKLSSVYWTEKYDPMIRRIWNWRELLYYKRILFLGMEKKTWQIFVLSCNRCSVKWWLVTKERYPPWFRSFGSNKLTDQKKKSFFFLFVFLVLFLNDLKNKKGHLCAESGHRSQCAYVPHGPYDFFLLNWHYPKKKEIWFRQPFLVFWSLYYQNVTYGSKVGTE